MRADCGLFPSLGRYFGTMSEMASAGCMSRRRLYSILKGEKSFTKDEQKAIANAIIVKAIREEKKTDVIDELITGISDFDELFKSRSD